MKNKVFILYWSLCALLLTSCHKTKTFHQFSPIPTEGWGKTDTIGFDISKLHSDTLIINIDIRHDYSYPYQDIYLTIRENLSDSTRYKTNTLHLKLADEFGDWTGDGWSYLTQSSHHYKTILKPQFSENSRIEIQSLMKDSLLQGVTDIGISINHKDDKPSLRRVLKK